MWPFRVEKKLSTPAEEKLDVIKSILFPPTELQDHVDKDGTKHKLQVDYSADMNLYAAIIDLEEGHNDQAVHNTVKDVHDRIVKIRNLLEEYMQLSKEAEYIIVENLKEEIDE